MSAERNLPPAGEIHNDAERRTKIARATIRASSVDPMLLLRQETLPEGPGWLYELKLDGYRAMAIKSDRKTEIRSRNNNDFSPKYPSIVEALKRATTSAWPEQAEVP